MASVFFNINPNVILDIVSAALRIACVMQFVANNKKTWILGSLTSLLGLFNIFRIGLYIKFVGKIIILAIQFIAWNIWKKQESSVQPTISNLSYYSQKVLLAIFPIATILMVYIRIKLFSSNLSSFDILLDALSTTLEYFALYLSVSRIIQCWYVWIIYDILSSYIFFSNGLICNCISSVIMMLSAIYGYYNWDKISKIENKNNNNYSFSS